MPILCEPDGPLDQGDVLKGVGLFATSADQKPQPARNELAMVLSRPCVIENKGRIIVAEVKVTDENLALEDDCLDSLLAALELIRDGSKSPDRFYIGQLPSGPPGRCYALLDSLFTIFLPAKGTVRDDFVQKSRIASMESDFKRDLHVRIFTAFSREGFDDLRWYSDADLQLVIATARQELTKNQITIHQAETAAAASNASGRSIDHKQATQAAKAQTKVDDLNRRITAWEAELTRRGKGR